MHTRDDDKPAKIIHVDMDAYYASVEQLDNPGLRDKPVAVGGSGKRGVVMAASYEARKFGIRSAMPSVTAQRKCPSLIFVKPRFERYRALSRLIRQIFARYTDLIEPLSLDEAYLDVTQNKLGLLSATAIARRIKAAIEAETGLTASAGVSINKFLAKMASGYQKPNGLTVIRPEEAEAFVEALPIERFFGIGAVTAAKMKKLGIQNGRDLKAWSELALSREFGKQGRYFYQIARGIDTRKVEPNRIRKSLSAELTYAEDLRSGDEAVKAIGELCELLQERIDKHRAYGRTLTLKVKYSDFRQITRSITLEQPFDQISSLRSAAFLLIRKLSDWHLGVRLLGLGVSNFHRPEAEPNQLEFHF